MKKNSTKKMIIWALVGTLIIVVTIVALAIVTKKKDTIVFQGDSVKISVSSSDEADTAGGNVLFNGKSFEIFSSPEEAFKKAIDQKDKLSGTVESCSIEAVDFDGYDRVTITVIWVDDQLVNTNPIAKLNRTNWNGAINLAEYAGHQVTLMITAESGIMPHFSYISFFLPTEEGENN